MLILAGVGAGPKGDFESIATTTVGSGGSSTITFSSIPSTYKHLQVRYISRDSNGQHLSFKANNDSGSNYAFHRLAGNGSSASALASAGRTDMVINQGGTSTTANIFNAGVVDILDYADTNKYKTIRTLNGVDYNGSGYVELISNLWMSTSAISTLTFAPFVGSFSEYTQLALYGIKG
jgi:hypothetical protein